jgi:hypothetical protein
MDCAPAPSIAISVADNVSSPPRSAAVNLSPKAHPLRARHISIASHYSYRFAPWDIEDVNGIPRRLPGGYANVTRGDGMNYEQVVFLGPGTTIREEFHLKRGHVRKLEQVGFASRVAEAGSELN